MRLKKALAIIVGILALILVFLLLVAYAAFSPSRDEVLRVTSPSGEMEAVVFEVNGGATTSFAYEVDIEDSRLFGIARKVAYTYGAIRNNKGAYGVTPHWVSDEELHIEYYSSRHDELFSPYQRLFAPPVRVEMKLNINDLTAPAGGMQYNLKPNQ